MVRLLLISFVIFLFTACNANKEDVTTADAKQETVAQKKTKSGHPANIQNTKKSVANKTKANKVDPMKAGGLDWMTMEEAGAMKNGKGKKYLVDVYTDWCGWCKVMDKKTFSDPEVKKYLEDNFHVVKFNAEQKDAINFKGKEYNWTAGGRKGYNTLAFELMGGRMSYPTMVYLDENLNKIKSVPGYKKPEQLLAELAALN